MLRAIGARWLRDKPAITPETREILTASISFVLWKRAYGNDTDTRINARINALLAEATRYQQQRASCSRRRHSREMAMDHKTLTTLTISEETCAFLRSAIQEATTQALEGIRDPANAEAVALILRVATELEPQWPKAQP